MNLRHKILLFILSFFIVGFGQPAWNGFLGLLTATFGYALFWGILITERRSRYRFWLAVLWFMGVQLVQLSWLNTHPYSYIYAVYLLFSFFLGLQFGCVGLLITPQRVQSFLSLLGISGVWTLLEWSRLFFFSGFSWNPVGLSLSCSFYAMQTASLWGVYGMSFWVILVNLLALRAVFFKKRRWTLMWLMAVSFPYIFGRIHVASHHLGIEHAPKMSIVLVQTSFPIEETMNFSNRQELVGYVIEEWRQILTLLSGQKEKEIDLIALPEYVVPFGTYSPIYPYEIVKKSFQEILGEEAVACLAPLESPYAQKYEYCGETYWFVTNAFWLQSLANIYHTALIAGLEDVEEISPGHFDYYSAAMYFEAFTLPTERYAKRILLPFAEYIPFEFCKKIAADYGIGGSFCAGKEAVIFYNKKSPFGTSICYEETFGHLMREVRQKGGHLLVNLTNDSWYPHSRLTCQHFDHARLRSIENGIPHVRACNTGLTCGLDSLGQVVGKIEGGDSVADSLYVKVPTYHYSTLYSFWGDYFIISMSGLFLFFLFKKRKNS